MLLPSIFGENLFDDFFDDVPFFDNRARTTYQLYCFQFYRCGNNT